jgi:EmrB/QacA subfamily drug resistance transporter
MATSTLARRRFLTRSAGPLTTSRRPGRQSLALFVILTAQLMVVLDGTIVNVALPHIQRALGFSGSGLSWVLNAYILTFGGLLLLGARAGDLLGRRRTFLLGIAVFSLGSLAGGLATASWMLLSARALQGVGAAFAAPSSLALLTTLFPDGAQRVRAIGLFTTVSAAGGAIGLVAGGLLTQWASWRWVMFVNVPIGITVWLVGRAVLVETARRHGRFDIAGAITSTAGMTLIVLGLVEAGSSGWADPITVGSLVLGVALLAAFVWDERRASEPILPLRLLSNATRSSANLARGLVYAGMYGSFFFLSQFLQDVQGHSPLSVGLGFLPIPASVFLGSQLTSRFLVGRVRPKSIMLSGAGLSALGLLFSTQLYAAAPYAQVLVSLVLLGAGAGIALVSLTSASLAGVDPKDAGAASGLINVVQQLGAALGLAVLVTLFGVVAHHAQIASASFGAGSHADAVVVHGLDIVFGVGAGFALLAMAIVALFVRPMPSPASVPSAVTDRLANPVTNPVMTPVRQPAAEEPQPQLDLRGLEASVLMDEARMDEARVDAGLMDAGLMDGARTDGARIDGARMAEARMDEAWMDEARMDEGLMGVDRSVAVGELAPVYGEEAPSPWGSAG